MLIVCEGRGRRELDFSIFLSHETVPDKVVALAQKQICADHFAVRHLDPLLRPEQYGGPDEDVFGDQAAG